MIKLTIPENKTGSQGTKDFSHPHFNTESLSIVGSSLAKYFPNSGFNHAGSSQYPACVVCGRTNDCRAGSSRIFICKTNPEKPLTEEVYCFSDGKDRWMGWSQWRIKGDRQNSHLETPTLPTQDWLEQREKEKQANLARYRYERLDSAKTNLSRKERDQLAPDISKKLVLSEVGRKNLLSRGLTEEQITVGGFASISLGDDQDWLPENYRFYPKGENFLVPCRSFNGEYQGYQIWQENGEPKYKWQKSGPNSTGSSRLPETGELPLTFYGDRQSSTLYLVEGILKPYVAWCLLDPNQDKDIAVVGSSGGRYDCNGEVAPELAEILHGMPNLAEVRICLDQGDLYNNHVRETRLKSFQLIKSFLIKLAKSSSTGKARVVPQLSFYHSFEGDVDSPGVSLELVPQKTVENFPETLFGYTFKNNKFVPDPKVIRTEGKYLPDLKTQVSLSKRFLLSVVAPKGSGKTHQIVELIKLAKSLGMDVVIITPRRLLAENMSERTSIPLVYDFQGQDGKPVYPDSFVVVANSFAKVAEGKDFSNTILILDEIDGNLEHALCSKTFGDSKSGGGDVERQMFLDSFRRIMAEARGVVALSADNTDKYTDFLVSLNPSLEVVKVAHTKEKPVTQATRVTKADFPQVVLDFLDKGEKIIGMVDTADHLEAFGEMLQEYHPTKKIYVLTRNTSGNPEFTGFRENPNKWVEEHKPDVFLYNSTGSAGIDISYSWFTHRVLWGMGVVSPEELRQGLGRERNNLPLTFSCVKRGFSANFKPTNPIERYRMEQSASKESYEQMFKVNLSAVGIPFNQKICDQLWATKSDGTINLLFYLEQYRIEGLKNDSAQELAATLEWQLRTYENCQITDLALDSPEFGESVIERKKLNRKAFVERIQEVELVGIQELEKLKTQQFQTIETRAKQDKYFLEKDLEGITEDFDLTYLAKYKGSQLYRLRQLLATMALEHDRLPVDLLKLITLSKPLKQGGRITHKVNRDPLKIPQFFKRIGFSSLLKTLIPASCEDETLVVPIPENIGELMVPIHRAFVNDRRGREACKLRGYKLNCYLSPEELFREICKILGFSVTKKRLKLPIALVARLTKLVANKYKNICKDYLLYPELIETMYQLLFDLDHVEDPSTSEVVLSPPPLDLPENRVWVSGNNFEESVLALINTNEPVYLDLETTGLNPRQDRIRLLTVLIGGIAYCYDFFTLSCGRIEEILAALSRELTVVIHNASFDSGFLSVLGWEYSQVAFFDTMVVAKQLNYNKSKHYNHFDDYGRPVGDGTRISYGAAAVAKRWAGITLNKAEQKSDWTAETLSPQQIEYAFQDVEWMPVVHKRMLHAIEQRGLAQVVELEHRTLHAVVQMEANGLAVDSVQLEKLIAELKPQKEAKLEDLREVVGDCQFNPNSSSQVKSLLGTVDAKKTTLKALGCARSALILEVKLLNSKISKLVGNKGSVANCLEQGRIYGKFNQVGTNTGRFSSSKPNLQQVPKFPGFREMYAAPGGSKIVKADYGQIELRVCAEMRSDLMLQAFREGKDLHRVTASLVLGIPESEVTKADRQVAKALNFGLIYGANFKTFRKYARDNYGVELTEAEAEKLCKKFWQAYPDLKENLDKAKNLKDYPRTVAGRQTCPYTPTSKANYLIQGSSADITKEALARMAELLHHRTDIKLLACIHDEILLEAKDEVAQEAAELLERVMVESAQCYLKRVPVVVDTEIKQTW